MPIFKRFKIDRYKEVMINQSTGLIPDGGFSTYTFDNESNGDFVGIVKDIRLIGEVTEITLDSGRFSQNELNNTTQSEFDQLVSNRTIRITERTLGWVEIAKTRASFYYEECSPTSFVRKRPVSEHYYDFLTFGFGTSLLAGSGLQDTDSQYSVGEAALRPVGTFDPNIGNNMGVFGPGFNQIDLQSYMRMVINSTISQGQGLIQNQQGEFRGVNGWSPLDGEILRQIPLYLVNKDEHFNNPNSQTISSGKYGRNRDVILEGFRASSYMNADFSKSIGVCLDTTILNTFTSVNTISGDGIDKNILDVNYVNSAPDIDTEKLLEMSLRSLLKEYPGFRYDKTLMSEPQAIVFFDSNFPEIDSIGHSVMYAYGQQLTKSSFYDVLKNIELEIAFDRLSEGDSNTSSVDLNSNA